MRMSKTDGMTVARTAPVMLNHHPVRRRAPEGAEYAELYRPLLARSPRMERVATAIERVADTDATVLIRGESGVGKEVAARALHAASPRRQQPFVKVNCAALPPDLLESELFGHEKGAFTGAYRLKPGTFEVARSGTILLDEIGDMPIGLQAKLLHVLQDQRFVRVGGSDVIRTDVRVVACTNRPLEAAMAKGLFREDLFYRLNVVVLHIPPLRERPEEIIALAQAFLTRFNEQYGRDVTLGPQTLHRLTQYRWPGNVRELENVVKRAVVLRDELEIVQEIGPAIQRAEVAPAAGAEPSANGARAKAPNLREIARQAAIDAERAALLEVLERVRWNRAEAARLFGISYKALLYKIDRCGLERKRPRRTGPGSASPPDPPGPASADAVA